MSQNVPGLTTGQPAIQPFFTATQEMLSGGVENFALTLLNPTTLRVPAGAGHDQASISIGGKYRFASANVDRVVAGGAGVYDVFVTASDNDFTGTPPAIDVTNYAFALAVVASGGSPAGVALYRKVGVLTWDGAAVTVLTQTVGAPSAAALPLRRVWEPITKGQIVWPAANSGLTPRWFDGLGGAGVVGGGSWTAAVPPPDMWRYIAADEAIPGLVAEYRLVVEMLVNTAPLAAASSGWQFGLVKLPEPIMAAATAVAAIVAPAAPIAPPPSFTIGGGTLVFGGNAIAGTIQKWTAGPYTAASAGLTDGGVYAFVGYPGQTFQANGFIVVRTELQRRYQ